MHAKFVGPLIAILLLATSLSIAGNVAPTPATGKDAIAPSTGNDVPPSGNNALRKLGRGLANLCFGIVEMPNTITKTTADQGGASGVTYGVGKGIVRWFCRELAGVYDIVTFPIPVPHGYKPVMKPEFPNEDYEP